MQKQTTDVAVVKNSVTAVLQNQKALWKGVQDIDFSIAANERQLSRELASIENAQANIDITRHWYGTVDINSICESLTNVYDDLREYIQTCGSAIRTTNENLSHTLGLIKLLVMIEKDLYEKLDDEAVQGNVLKELIRDWCKKNNIRDEEVNQLLETSFQRAYTLRDRINNLRGEISNKLARYDTELLRLSLTVDGLKTFVSSEKVKALNNLSELYKAKESLLNKLSIEKNNEMIRLHENKVQSIKTLSKTIDDKSNECLRCIKSQRDEVTNQVNEIKDALSKNLNDLTAKQQQAIHAIDSKASTKSTEISELEEKIKDSLTTQESAFVEKVKSAIKDNNEALQEALNKISAQTQSGIAQYKELSESITKAQQEYKLLIEKEKQSYSSEAQSSLDMLHERLHSSLTEIENKSNEGKKEFSDMKNKIDSDTQAAQSQIKEQIQLFEDSLAMQIDAQKKEYEALLDSQQTNFSDALKKAHGTAKRWAIGGAITGAGLASAISYVISLFL